MRKKPRPDRRVESDRSRKTRWRSSTTETSGRCSQEDPEENWAISGVRGKNRRNQESQDAAEESDDKRMMRRRSATAKSDSRCRHGGRWILLAGASHVKQLFVYLSYPAVQLSSAISGTRSSSSSRAVTTRTPCASTSAPASAPGSRITVKEQNPLLQLSRHWAVVIAPCRSSSSDALVRAQDSTELSIGFQRNANQELNAEVISTAVLYFIIAVILCNNGMAKIWVQYRY